MTEVVIQVAPAGRVCEDVVETRVVGSTRLIALADGAGGMGGGAHAALAAVRGALSPRPGTDLRAPYGWLQLLGELDARLEQDPEAGETTLVVAAVWTGGIVGASVGDSGAWLLGDPPRELTHGQHRKPLLGSGAACPVSFAAEWPEGPLLLASDGLLKYAPLAAICRAAQGDDPDHAARKLVELVRLRSGALQDDVAVVLCKQVAR